MKSALPIFGPPNNNSRNEPAAPIVGIDGRLYCPACKASVHRTRTPERCPECLQALIRPHGPECDCERCDERNGVEQFTEASK